MILLFMFQLFVFKICTSILEATFFEMINHPDI